MRKLSWIIVFTIFYSAFNIGIFGSTRRNQGDPILNQTPDSIVQSRPEYPILFKLPKEVRGLLPPNFEVLKGPERQAALSRLSAPLREQVEREYSQLPSGTRDKFLQPRQPQMLPQNSPSPIPRPTLNKHSNPKLSISGGVSQTWASRYNGPGISSDQPSGMAIDPNGNVYVLGSSYHYGGNDDYFIIKYSPSGSQQWMLDLGWAYARRIAVDSIGNVYAAGYDGVKKFDTNGNQVWISSYVYSSWNDFGVDINGNSYLSGEYNSDFVTVKFNSDGIMAWIASYNGPANNYDYANALAFDHIGNLYVTGNSWNGSDYDITTIKYDSSGVQIWVVQYSGSGGYWDNGNAIAVDSNENAYVAGYSNGGVTIKYNSSGDTLWTAHRCCNSNSAVVVDSGNVYVTGWDGTIKYDSSGNELWSSSITGYEIAKDTSGNVITTGYYYSSTSVDYRTVKYGANGDTLWIADYDGPNGKDDNVVALALDAQGNVYVSGSSIDIGVNSDIATIKYTSSGTQEWVNRYDGSRGISNDVATAITTDTSGNVFVTGYSYSETGQDYATVKYDSNGNSLWLARFNGGGQPYAIAVADSGNVYVTGDGGTVKYDVNGNQLWVASFVIGGRGLVLHRDGSLYVTGSYWRNGTYYDYATVKYNSGGDTLWVAYYDGPASLYDFVNAIAIDSASNVCVTGYSYNADWSSTDYATVKYDSSGTELWVQRYDGPASSYDEGTDITVDASGNVYVTGISRAATGEDNYATVKYDESGTEMWVSRHHQAGSYFQAYSIAVDESGNVYVTGYGGGTIKINTSGNEIAIAEFNINGQDLTLDQIGNIFVRGTNYSDYITVKYDSDLDTLWVAQYDGPANMYDEANALVINRNGNVYVTGQSSVSGGSYDYATVKYTQIATISGVVFNDVNADSMRNVGEPGLGDWKVYLSGPLVDSIYTDSDGRYLFSDLPTGTYTVSEELKGGWAQTYPAPPGLHTVALSEFQNIIDLDFGNISPDISISKDTLNYGSVFLGVSLTETLRVSNAGTSSLAVSDISSDNADYTPAITSFNLDPGQSQDVVATFAPSAAGERVGSLSIASNDPIDSIVTVSLQGVGVIPPDIGVSPSSLTVNLFSGDSTTQTLTISNTGGSDLTWEIMISPPGGSLTLSSSPVFHSSSTVDKNKKISFVSPGRPGVEDIYAADLSEVNTRAKDKPIGLSLREGVVVTTATLEKVLESLNANYQTITDAIPNRFDFVEGESGSSISDGGNDMYDGGNFLGTNLSGSVAYSDNTILSSSYFGVGGRYFTRKYPGLFVLVADVEGVDYFEITGNVGADGSGNVDGAILETQLGGATHRGFVKRVYNAWDPSVNHLIIVADNPSANHEFSTNTDNDYHRVFNLSTTRRVYYLLYAGADGYYIDNNATLAIMNNFLNALRLVPDWLSVHPNSGIVPAGSSEDVSITFSAAHVDSGGYDADILVLNNDPDEDTVTIPTQLNVNSLPQIILSNDTLDFDTVFTGYSAVETLVVSSTGTGALDVSNIASDNADYTIDTTNFILNPGQSQQVLVRFAPSAAGDRNATLTITSNDPYKGTVSLALRGVGLIPPNIGVSPPSSLTANLFSGDSTTQTLTISNTGGSDLSFTLSITTGGSVSPTPAKQEFTLAPVAQATQRATDRNLTQRAGVSALISSSKDLRYTTSSSMKILLIAADDASRLQAELQGAGYSTVDIFNAYSATPSLSLLELYDVLIVWSNYPFADRNALGDILASYIEGGGNVIPVQFSYGSGWEIGGRFISGGFSPLLPGLISYTTKTLGTFQVGHPLMAGVSSGSDNYSSVVTLTSGSDLVASYTDGTPLVATKPNVIAINVYYGDNRTFGGDMLRILFNAVEYRISWLFAYPTSGTVPADSSMDITVAFNAVDIDSGDYNADILIFSNDPDEDTVTVSTTLNVINAPSIFVDPSNISFDSTFVGWSNADTIIVINNGSIPLVVNNITSSGPFNINSTGFTLNPGQKLKLTISFIPTDSGSLNGNITFYSNDPSDPVLTVPLSGKAMHPPVIGVSPQSFVFTLSEGDSTTSSLTINNTGLGALQFDIENEFIFPPPEQVQKLTNITNVKNEKVTDPYKKYETLNIKEYDDNIEERTINFINDLGRRLFGVYRNRIYELNINTGQPIRNIPIPQGDWWSSGLAFSGSRLYYADGWGQKIYVVDPNSGKILNNFPRLPEWIDGLAYVNGKLYALAPGSNTIYEMNPYDGTILRTIVPGVYIGGGLDGGNGRLFVSNYSNAIYELSIVDGSIINSISPVSNVIGIGFCGDTLYTCGSGYIDKYNPNTGEHLGRLPYYRDYGALAGGTSNWLSENPTAGIISPGGNQHIDLKISAKEIHNGDYQANIIINSNDPANNQKIIPANLTVLGVPDILVSTDSLQFDSTYINVGKLDSIIIRNTGTESLTISNITSNNLVFTASPVNTTIPIGSKKTIYITFIPTELGDTTGTLTINSDDPDQPVTLVHLSGIGITPPPSISGTMTVGVGGDFTTLKEAFDSINACYLSDTLDLLLIDQSYIEPPLTLKPVTNKPTPPPLTISPGSISSKNRALLSQTQITIDTANSMGDVGIYLIDAPNVQFKDLNITLDSLDTYNTAIRMEGACMGVSFENVILDAGNAYMGFEVWGNNASLNILSCDISHVQTGIQAYEYTSLSIHKSTISHDQEFGIWMEISSGNVVIDSNSFNGNMTAEAAVGGSAEGNQMVIDNNTILNYQWCGISLDGFVGIVPEELALRLSLEKTVVRKSIAQIRESHRQNILIMKESKKRKSSLQQKYSQYKVDKLQYISNNTKSAMQSSAASVSISGNNIISDSVILESGIYTGWIGEYVQQIDIKNNIVHGVTNGIFAEEINGGNLLIEENNISGFSDVGIYMSWFSNYYAIDAGSLSILHNNIIQNDSSVIAWAGIFCDGVEAFTYKVEDNIISGMIEGDGIIAGVFYSPEPYGMAVQQRKVISESNLSLKELVAKRWAEIKSKDRRTTREEMKKKMAERKSGINKSSRVVQNKASAQSLLSIQRNQVTHMGGGDACISIWETNGPVTVQINDNIATPENEIANGMYLGWMGEQVTGIEIERNRVSKGSFGIYMDGAEINPDGSFIVRSNDIETFGGEGGLWLGEVFEPKTIEVINNTVRAVEPLSALMKQKIARKTNSTRVYPIGYEGITVFGGNDWIEGSTFKIDSNTVSGFEWGIHPSIYTTGDASVSYNTLTDGGIMFEEVMAGNLAVNNNRITEFNDAGIIGYFSPYDYSVPSGVSISRNTIVGSDSSGGWAGICFEGGVEAYTYKIEDNIVSGNFEGDGIIAGSFYSLEPYGKTVQQKKVMSESSLSIKERVAKRWAEIKSKDRKTAREEMKKKMAERRAGINKSSPVVQNKASTQSLLSIRRNQVTHMGGGDACISIWETNGPVTVQINDNIATPGNEISNGMYLGWMGEQVTGIEIERNRVSKGYFGIYMDGAEISPDGSFIVRSNDIETFGGEGGLWLGEVSEPKIINIKNNSIKAVEPLNQATAGLKSLRKDINGLKFISGVGLSIFPYNSQRGSLFTLEGNEIENYELGTDIYIGGFENVLIARNTLNNNLTGLSLYGDFEPCFHSGLIVGNNLTNNKFGGVLTFGSYPIPFRVSYNTITENDSVGLFFDECESTPITQHNNIYGNGKYSILNNANKYIDARFNWWGDTIKTEMDSGSYPKNISTIYDQFDDPLKGFVEYADWLSEPESGYGTICGKVFNDVNGNGALDAGEQGLKDWLVEINPLDRYTSTDDNGDYKFDFIPLGIYTIKQIPKMYWQQTYPVSPTFIIDTLHALDIDSNLNFGNQIISGKKDLSVTISGSIPRPGFERYNIIRYESKGTDQTNGTVTMQYPEHVTYLSSSPAHTAHLARIRTVIWDRGLIDPGDVGYIRVNVRLAAPPIVNIGDTLITRATISATGNDENPADNEDIEYALIQGAYDPNDKLNYLDRAKVEGYTPITSTLTYMIRFQNTGTVAAEWVSIVDTLDSALDIATVSVGAASHPYTFEITGDRELIWRFTDINLPDSVSDEPGSHGFVTFKVKPQIHTEQPDTLITNSAGIYFDYNPPVLTNTVENKLINATRLYFSSGWNLLSVPVKVLNNKKSELFPTASTDAFNYVGNYEQQDSLYCGFGYWLKFDSVHNHLLYGFIKDSVQVQVRNGWNMVGGPSLRVYTNSIIKSPGISTVTEYFGYGGLYYSTTTLEPGNGYWIKVQFDEGTTTGYLQMFGTTGMIKSNDIVQDFSNLSSIIITDRLGRSQLLYLGETNQFTVPLTRYELPPAAPEFDARFESGRMIGAFSSTHSISENTNDEFPILIDADQFPLKVEWNIVKSPSGIQEMILTDGKRTLAAMSSSGSVEISDTKVKKLYVKLSSGIPQEFVLYQNFPNPFNPTTTIRYALPMDANVRLILYNVLGQEIKSLIDDVQDAGYKKIELNSTEYASGVYFYRLEANGISNPNQRYTNVKKMILLK